MNAAVQELFHQLADLTVEQRNRYCTEHQVDPQTRQHAEALLAFDAGFDAGEDPDLDQNIRFVADQVLTRFDRNDQRCGPFRLIKVIGRGGMGVVYLAERADGEVRQRAAVKLLGPGLASLQQERFLQEREILAGFTHPNIAHLLDAGHTADGQAYLAMEYVEGQPLDAFAGALDDRHKIQLFLKVCAAVAYLHRHLVVHCDLKPSNILVTADGEPKVLDFGIAKILEPQVDPQITNVRMLTPDYASPEQLTGGRVGTPTDIYSLAAVLKRIMATAVRGDLSVILTKAMRPEPRERYATVEQLAEDLEAFLDSRPIRARQGELAYQARKFAQRYWLPIAATALTLAGLSAGLFVANRERLIAQRRFDDVRELSNRLFDIDVQVRQLPGASKTRQVIVDTSLEYLARLAQDHGRDPVLDLDLGTAHMRVARVQGVPISPNLGQANEAEKNLKIAERLIASVLQVQPENRKALLRAAQIAHDRMVLAESRQPNTPALPLARQSEVWLQRYLRSGPVDGPRTDVEAVVIVGMNVAYWYSQQDLADDSIRLLRQTAGIAKATNQLPQVGAIQINVARALRRGGDLEGALAAIQEGVKLLTPAPGETRYSLRRVYRFALNTQGQILGSVDGVSLGRTQEAADSFERAFAIARDLAAQDPHEAESRLAIASDGMLLANTLRHTDAARAIAVYDLVRAASAELKNNPRARRNEAAALAASTYPLRDLGRSVEAGQRLDEAFRILAELKRYPASSVELWSEPDQALRALAEQQALTGHLAQGIDTYRQLLDKIMASKPEPETNLEDAADLSNLYRAMARLHQKAQQIEAATALQERRAELWRHWNRKLPNNPFVRRQLVN